MAYVQKHLCRHDRDHLADPRCRWNFCWHPWVHFLRSSACSFASRIVVPRCAHKRVPRPTRTIFHPLSPGRRWGGIFKKRLASRTVRFFNVQSKEFDEVVFANCRSYQRDLRCFEVIQYSPVKSKYEELYLIVRWRCQLSQRHHGPNHVLLRKKTQSECQGSHHHPNAVYLYGKASEVENRTLSVEPQDILGCDLNLPGFQWQMKGKVGIHYCFHVIN